MDILVSVIVTCYNHESYIGDCLESIFKQSYTNIELLIFNDGSSDGSAIIIDDLIKRTPFEKTQYFYHENKGVVITRNIALEHITGDYFVFVDSDDVIEQDYIKLLLKTAEKQEADIVYTALHELASGDVVLPVKEYDLQELFIGNFIHASSLIKKTSIGSIRFDERLNREKLEDYDFYLQLLTSKKLIAVPCYDTALNYRMSLDSRSGHQNYKSYYKVYSYIIGKYLTSFPEYVNKALLYHFDRLTNLDIEHSIKEEEISIYLSSNEKFESAHIYQEKIKFQDKIEVPIKKGEYFIRIKPSNIPSFYESFVLKSKKYQTEIHPTLSNGLVDEEAIIFEDFHPFIDYHFNSLEDDILILFYKRYNINDIVSKDYIGKLLAKQKYERLQVILLQEQVQNQLEKVIAEKTLNFEKLNNEYEMLLSDYNAITNTIWWKLITKIKKIIRR